MKVAVTIFKGGVSPRLDITDSLWIYQIDEEHGNFLLKEKCEAAFEHVDQMIRLFTEKDVTRILCGGCPQFLLRMLILHDLEIIPGVMGDPEESIKQLAQGKFPPPLLGLGGLPGRFCRHGNPTGTWGRHGKRKNKRR